LGGAERKGKDDGGRGAGGHAMRVEADVRTTEKKDIPIFSGDSLFLGVEIEIS
jgi:hypothetical protein